MKAAKDAGDEYYDPTGEDNILGKNKTRLALREEHLKDPIVALDKALKCVENSYWRSRPKCMVEGVSCNGWRWLPPKFVRKADLGGRCGPIWPRWKVCLRTASVEWNVPGKYGPHGELFFILSQKEQATMPDSETFSPFINADIRTPFFSAESLRSARLAPCTGLRKKEEMERYVVFLVWVNAWESGLSKESNVGGEAWSEDESVSSNGAREGNVDNEALHVIGLYGPGDKISLFLKDWELA